MCCSVRVFVCSFCHFSLDEASFRPECVCRFVGTCDLNPNPKTFYFEQLQ